MKSKLNFQHSSIIDSLIKIFIAIILIIAATTDQERGFYSLLRWIVMTSFIYFGYKLIFQRNYGLLIFFSAVILIFNPFHEFWFGRSTWRIIDLLVATLVIATLIYDWWKNLIQKDD